MKISNEAKLLVVDDNKHIRESHIRVIRKLGFTGVILEAEDGVVAIGLLKKMLEQKTPVDIILSDYQMPHMNGLQLLKEVRQDESLGKTPFLLITTEGDKDTVLQFMKNKVTSFLLKPYTPDQMAEKLDLCSNKS